MKKIYGIRICLECRGTCHEASWRSKVGQRKTYFCCEKHLKRYCDNKLTNRLRKAGLFGNYSWGEDWIEYRDEFYERAEVGSA